MLKYFSKHLTRFFYTSGFLSETTVTRQRIRHRKFSIIFQNTIITFFKMRHIFLTKQYTI